jgi:hypothetical protein
MTREIIPEEAPPDHSIRHKDRGFPGRGHLRIPPKKLKNFPPLLGFPRPADFRDRDADVAIHPKVEEPMRG